MFPFMKESSRIQIYIWGAALSWLFHPTFDAFTLFQVSFPQVVFPKRSADQFLLAPQNCISWNFLKYLEPSSKPLAQTDRYESTPIDAQSCCTSAQLAFDNIMLLHQHILPRWLDIGDVFRVALSTVVASCSDRFRSMNTSDPDEGAPLNIVFRTDDQEPVLILVQTLLTQLCNVFKTSFGIVYPNTICVSRDSKSKTEDSSFATTLHLMRSGVILIPQIQELFSDTKANGSKIDILETIAQKVPQVPGTCIIGIWCEHGMESTKTKTSNQVRLERMWDLHFCCKETAKADKLLGLLESASIGPEDHSSFVSEAQVKFGSKNDRPSIQEPNSRQDYAILRAYTQSVAMLTSAAAPAGFSIVKRECNTKHLIRLLRAIRCAHFGEDSEGDCILAYVPVFLMMDSQLTPSYRIWLIEESLASRGAQTHHQHQSPCCACTHTKSL